MNEPLKILSLRVMPGNKVRIFASGNMTKEEKIALLEQALEHLTLTS